MHFDSLNVSRETNASMHSKCASSSAALHIGQLLIVVILLCFHVEHYRPIYTRRILISEGVTPLILEACPIEEGAIALSFSFDSEDKARIFL